MGIPFQLQLAEGQNDDKLGRQAVVIWGGRAPCFGWFCGDQLIDLDKLTSYFSVAMKSEVTRHRQLCGGELCAGCCFRDSVPLMGSAHHSATEPRGGREERLIQRKGREQGVGHPWGCPFLLRPQHLGLCCLPSGWTFLFLQPSLEMPSQSLTYVGGC